VMQYQTAFHRFPVVLLQTKHHKHMSLSLGEENNMKPNPFQPSRHAKAHACWLAFVAFCFAGNNASASNDRHASCDDFLPEPRTVGGHEVGPESCLMQQGEVAYDGRTFVRVDLGLDGTAEGYVKMEGPYHEYVTNGPDLLFKQAATPGKRHLAIVNYERMRGTAVLLMYPKSRADWNGKLWVTAHGRGRSFRNGALKKWDRYYDREDPMAAFHKIHRVMLSKGYALAVTNRTSEQDVGELVATLDDGTVVDWAAFNDTSSIIMDFTAVAEAVLRERLGKAPSRTYLYGHSAGARIARSLNYTPGLNADSRGNPVFDGFLLDDSATGLWLPVVMEGGKDVLFDSDAEKRAFRPQVELVHTMYNKVWVRSPNRPDWVSQSYVANKRRNARILMDKGLGSKFRMFEIEQMSHNGGERLPPDNRYGKIHVLDVSLVIDGAIDMVDMLAEGTGVPTPSKSNWSAIGDADGDGEIENPAILYPEVACPLGVFYPYPKMGSGTTAFAAFTGEGVEPLDETDVFVDMNRNAVWDFRETPSEAWRRLGLLDSGERLSRERYVQCIREAATGLQEDGLFSEATVDRYVQEAQLEDLTPSTD
jgi:Alpha/beta hydrolase domain